MRIYIPEAQGDIIATKGIFVGEDSEGKRIFATGNIQAQDLTIMISQLVEYGMIRIATEAMMADSEKPISFEELAKQDPELIHSMFKC